MNSKKSKSYSCKHRIESTIHQPVRIRTNKHRCFVFCVGHRSLTCVPGIGKRNKTLLNQSGIPDLFSLYAKYRSIDNNQYFQQWLQNDIGFTSYQAEMTTCGIGSKLGIIKDINTGLTPICCPLDRKHKLLSNDEIKQTILSDSKIKQEEPLSIQTNNPTDHLTSVKSPDDPLFATRPSPPPPPPPHQQHMDESDSSSVFNESLLSKIDLSMKKSEKLDTNSDEPFSGDNTYESLWLKESTSQSNEEETPEDLFVSTKQTLHPTLDELLSDLKYSHNSDLNLSTENNVIQPPTMVDTKPKPESTLCNLFVNLTSSV